MKTKTANMLPVALTGKRKFGQRQWFDNSISRRIAEVQTSFNPRASGVCVFINVRPSQANLI